jgi:hypothetical protein
LPVLLGLSRCGAVLPHRALSVLENAMPPIGYRTVDLIGTI